MSLPSYKLTINIIILHTRVKNAQITAKFKLVLLPFDSIINIYHKAMYKTDATVLYHFGFPNIKELKFKNKVIRIIPRKHKLNIFLFIKYLQIK